MKFFISFLLVLASVGIVTAQAQNSGGVLCTQQCKEMTCPGYDEPQMVCNIQVIDNTCTWVCPAPPQEENSGVVCPAVCKSVPCGPEGLLVNVCAAKVVNGKCTWPCPALTCAEQGKGCATVRCSTGPCVEDPVTCVPTCTSPPTLPTPCPQTCGNCGINGRCDIVDGCAKCVVNEPGCRSNEGAFVPIGGSYFNECNSCTCRANGLSICTLMACPAGVCWDDNGKQKPCICTEKCTAKCSAGESCVFDKTCTPTCRSSTANTCVLNDGNSRIVSGGKYYHQCNQCTCGDNGQPGVCTRIGCPEGPFNNDGTTQCVDCTVTNCGINAKCITNNGCGKCLVNPPQPICTEKCTAKCSAGQKCVFDKTCTPTCKSSTANTCLLNDGISRIVSGGKYYNQCNTCTCGGNGQPGVCTEIACEDGKYNNDGTLVPPPFCTEKCTKDCPFGQSCVFDKTCTPKCLSSTADTCVLNDGFSRIVSGGRYYQQCNQCTCQRGCTKKGCENTSVWNNDGTVPDILPHACFVDCQINGGCRTICQYPISFKIRYTGTIKQLATQLRKVATDAGIDSSLVVIDNTQLVLISSNIYRCRIVIKGSRGDTSNRDKYMVQLEKSFTVSGVIIFENGDNNNNEVELDSEIEMEPLGDAQPFTTQTCADDTTIAASASCPAITEEGMIIPTATSSSSSSFPLAIVIGSVVGGVIALVLLTTAIIIIQRRRTANKVVARTSAEQEMTNTV